ncbi:hypothetical protein WG901_09225 [Novosphingobium sp. PS1R-30]|uniref:Uncharacterized protein n=1 Tax=Novosphingobium anseongense TaxID=3133436 RepID=A0ABU8RUR0_9SPHN
MPDRAGCSASQMSAAAIRDGLRELTANLMRIARGAGRPELVLEQTLALVGFFEAHRAAAGEDLAAAQVAEALRLTEIPEDEEAVWTDWDRAVRAMVEGSLQVAAAEMMAQHAQAAAGRKELFAGYRNIEKLHSRQLRRLIRR